jgi:hypothetical protein
LNFNVSTGARARRFYAIFFTSHRGVPAWMRHKTRHRCSLPSWHPGAWDDTRDDPVHTGECLIKLKFKAFAEPDEERNDKCSSERNAIKHSLAR